MAIGFFTKFLGVQADKGVDSLMSMLVAWDPSGATETEKRMIGEKLSEFCVKCEEARKKMAKEINDVDVIKAQAADKVALYKKWSAELAEPATGEDRRKQIQSRLPAIEAELQAFGPKIDKEVREAEMATKLFETYDQVVAKTNEKLQQKIAQADQQTTQLEIAKAETALLEEQVTAARVLAGLTKQTDSFDMATNIVNKQTEKIEAKNAGLQREIEELGKVNPKADDFIAQELAAMKGTGNTGSSIADQLAALEGKLK